MDAFQSQGSHRTTPELLENQRQSLVRLA